MDFNPNISGEQKVFNFMDRVKEQEKIKKQENEFKNSYNYKLKCLENEKEKGKGVCLDAIFSKIYKDAIPLNDDYKVAYGDDLDAEFKDFIHDKCPKGMVYYVRDAANRGSKCAMRIMEKVNKIMDDEYKDRAMNIDKYTADDMVFKMNDDLQKKIDVTSNNLELPDITEVINNKVKSTATAEILRAKREKKASEDLEKELSNNMEITSESDISNYLELKGYTSKRTFQPSLFQGIMIGKMNQSEYLLESEIPNLYNAISEYKENCDNSMEEYVFVESIKEYTKLFILKTLCLEKYSLNDVRDMANEYAYTNKI